MSDDMTMIADLRARVLRGENVEPEEYAQAVKLIRQARRATPGKKSGTVTKSAEELLKDFI